VIVTIPPATAYSAAGENSRPDAVRNSDWAPPDGTGVGAGGGGEVGGGGGGKVAVGGTGVSVGGRGVSVGGNGVALAVATVVAVWVATAAVVDVAVGRVDASFVGLAGRVAVASGDALAGVDDDSSESPPHPLSIVVDTANTARSTVTSRRMSSSLRDKKRRPVVIGLL
jgi:hypothetical protein